MTQPRREDTVLKGPEDGSNQASVNQQGVGLRGREKPGEPEPAASRVKPAEKHPSWRRAGPAPRGGADRRGGWEPGQGRGAAGAGAPAPRPPPPPNSAPPRRFLFGARKGTQAPP